MPMREECKHFQSRTYDSGEVARFCVLDFAPEAPWKCPDNCPSYARRLADVGWSHGSLVEPALEPMPEVPGEEAAEILDQGGRDHQRRRPRRRGRGAQGGREERPQVVAPQALRADPADHTGSRPAGCPDPCSGSAPGEEGRPLLHEGGHGLDQVVRGQERPRSRWPRSRDPRPPTDPGRSVSTALVPWMAAASRRRSPRPWPERPPDPVGVGAHVVDQTDDRRPLGGDVLAGEGEFGHVALADDGRQPL